MEYPLDLEGFGIKGRVSVETGGFFSRSLLLVDGNPAQAGTRKGEFILRRTDESTVVARVQGVMLDPVPIVILDDKVIQAAEPFTFMQSFAAATSFIIALCLSIAGLINMPPLSKTPGIQVVGYLCMSINLFMGVLLGFTSMIVSRRILRSDMSRSSQIFSIGALTIIVIIGFLVVFLLLVGILVLFSGLEIRQAG